MLIAVLCLVYTKRDFVSLLFVPESYGALVSSQIELLETKSTLLSRFYNKEVKLTSALYVPVNNSSQALVVHVSGFGGSHYDAYRSFNRLNSIEKIYPELSAIHLYLDPRCPKGLCKAIHHGFVDSDVIGPWSKVLVSEIIPMIISEYEIDPKKIFITGHSSGAWSAIWLKLTYPDFFNSAFATAPDPLDFEDFYGIDLRPGSNDNFYIDKFGKARSFDPRLDIQLSNELESGKNNFKSLAPEIESCELRYGIKNSDNTLFNRDTGKLNQNTLVNWKKFDVASIVNKDPLKFKQVLDKIKIFVGDKDEYKLNTPTKSFCSKVNIREENCVFIKDRGHVNLYLANDIYPNGLDLYIYQYFIGSLK